MINLNKIISEGTIKTVIPYEQQTILMRDYNDREFNELDNFEQQELQKKLNDRLDIIQKSVNEITTNLQYKSWLYDRFAAGDHLLFGINSKAVFVHKIKPIFDDFATIVRSDKINSTQRNINNYSDLYSLKNFINDFQKESAKTLKLNKRMLLHTNNKYSIYKICAEDKILFQSMYGVNGFKCAWCVTHNDQRYFDNYINQGCYYLWTYKGSFKPFALLHFKSEQFKDIHNECLYGFDDEDVIDGLNFCVEYENYNWANCANSETDLSKYKWFIRLKSNTLGQLIASDDEILLYRDIYKLTGIPNMYILVNQNEVVGAFQLNGTVAIGLMSELESLFFTVSVKPQVVVDACKKEGEFFDNPQFQYYFNTRGLPCIIRFLSSSNVKVIGTVGLYNIIGSSVDTSERAYYVLQNSNSNVYVLKLSVTTLTAAFGNHERYKVIQIDPIIKQKAMLNEISKEVIEQALSVIRKINSHYDNVKYMIDNRNDD